MGTFQELGKKMDELAVSVKGAAQEGIGKTGGEVKEWRKRLDEIGERIKKTTQEGLEKFTTETRELGQKAKIRPQVWQKRKGMSEKFREMGELAYQLHLAKKIGNPQLKKMGAQITKIRREIESVEKEIKKPS